MLSSSIQATLSGRFGDSEYGRSKKAGEDPDIRGDYNEYSQTVSAGIGGHDVTLKGDDDLINVALWTADGYSYSIDTDQALTQEQMTAIIEIVE